MFTSAHAPTASRDVHKSTGGIRDAGTMVEKKARERGDYGSLIPGREMRRNQWAYVSECATCIWVYSVAE